MRSGLFSNARVHGPDGLPAVATYTIWPGFSGAARLLEPAPPPAPPRADTASARSNAPTCDLLKHGENTEALTTPSPMCQTCHASVAPAPAPASCAATVLWLQGMIIGVQTSPAHCSGENSNGPTGESDTKWPLEDTVVQFCSE